MHRIKSYGQNKIQSHIMAISFVFLPYFCPKMATPEEALPNGPQSSSLYFWNQWKQENRNNLQANSNSNFSIFCPPLMVVDGGGQAVHRVALHRSRVIVADSCWQLLIVGWIILVLRDSGATNLGFLFIFSQCEANLTTFFLKLFLSQNVGPFLNILSHFDPLKTF